MKCEYGAPPPFSELNLEREIATPQKRWRSSEPGASRPSPGVQSGLSAVQSEEPKGEPPTTSTLDPVMDVPCRLRHTRPTGPSRPHSRRRFVESSAAAVRYSRKAGVFRSGTETPEPTPPGILWRAAWYLVAADGRRAEGNPLLPCPCPVGVGGGKGYRYLEVSTRFGVWSGSVGGKNHGMEDGVGADGGNGGDGAPRGGPGMDSPSLSVLP